MIDLVQAELGIVAQAEVQRKLAGDAKIVLHEERKNPVLGVEPPCGKLAPGRHVAQQEFGIGVAGVLAAGVAGELASEACGSAGEEERVEARAVAAEVAAKAHVVAAG